MKAKQVQRRTLLLKSRAPIFGAGGIIYQLLDFIKSSQKREIKEKLETRNDKPENNKDKPEQKKAKPKKSTDKPEKRKD